MSLWIHPEVSLLRQADTDRVRFAHWEIALPQVFLDEHGALAAVLNGHAPIETVPDHPETRGIVGLLKAQGCFASRSPTTPCTLREFRRRFDPLKSLWYSRYYAHPAWHRLRSGQASRNELFAWVVHNYHISRIAGVVAARCTDTLPPPPFREHFLRDTLDEFWHAEAFYFVRHPSLNARDDDIKRYVPLPASRAFEVHTLQTAGRDLLGHLLIAYFQESTAAFLEDCVSFYQDVERAYGLPGFFESWEAHVRVDLDEGHAAGLAALFESDDMISAERQDAAMANAWLAYRYLELALDQVLAQARGDDQLDLRPPDRFCSIAPSGVSAIAARHWPALHAQFRHSLAEATLRCLSHCRDHDLILLMGQLLRAWGAVGEAPTASCVWARSLQSLLCEAATEPYAFLHLIRSLGEHADHRGYPLLQACWQERVAALGIRFALLPDHAQVDARMAQVMFDLALEEHAARECGEGA